MPEPPLWINLVLLAFALASGLVWLLVWTTYARRGVVLRYERRWPVPWGASGALLAGFVLFMTVAQTLASSEPVDATPFSSDTFITNAIASAAMSLMLAAAATVALVATSGAQRRDLGLPSSSGQLLSDCRLGLITALASLLPVYAVQSAVVYGFDIPSEHPVLMRLLSDPDPMVLIAAMLTAVVAAPIFEEIAFRLLLQGWLERVEDRVLAESGLMTFPDEEEQDDEREKETPPTDPPLDEALAADAENPFRSPEASDKLKPPPAGKRREPPIPPEATFAGLPHGWAPIAGASFAFALAHLGHGADPAALFVLALLLGYVYQRTHRILPCVVAHMAFNAFSLTLAYLSARFG